MPRTNDATVEDPSVWRMGPQRLVTFVRERCLQIDLLTYLLTIFSVRFRDKSSIRSQGKLLHNWLGWFSSSIVLETTHEKFDLRPRTKKL